MRLWSIHPCYLDSKGLVALWREGLLAQQVLLGNTKGYKRHPQLERFRGTSNSTGAIASYLRVIVEDANKRGYNFNKSKIINKRITSKIPVTSGQIDFEFEHLLRKLKTRDPTLYKTLKTKKRILPHPLFCRTTGNLEDWEVI